MQCEDCEGGYLNEITTRKMGGERRNHCHLSPLNTLRHRIMTMGEAEVMAPRVALAKLAEELSVKSVEAFRGFLAESGMG